MLEVMGCRVDAVVNGRKALSALSDGHYDLVLMDCQMPEMDGYAAAEKIRRREREKGGQRIPIVALTANAFSGERERCLNAGMDDYLSKPVQQQQLHEMLVRWLAKQPGARDTDRECGSNEG